MKKITRIIPTFLFACVLQANAQTPTLQDVINNGNTSQRAGENIIFKPSTLNGASYLRWYNSDNTPWGYLGYGTATNRWFYVDNGVNPVFVHPRLLIGVTSDDGTSALQVQGNISLARSGSSPAVVFSNGTKVWDMGNVASAFMINETGVNTRLVIKPGGNVGIGTQNPQAALQLGEFGNNASKLNFPGVYNFEKFHLGQEGNGAPFIEFINHASMTNSYGIKMGTNLDAFGTGFYIKAAPSTDSLKTLQYAVKPAFFINQSNQVGIGTNNTAGYTLAVAGSMIVERIKVKLQSAWPDYVFSDTYQLPSLQEVAAYIKTKGHLPGMPSAKQVADEHLDLGENQAAIVKKVEELTLYLLQQKEQIDRQQKTIMQLEEQLRQLQKK